MCVPCTVAQIQERAFNLWMLSKFFFSDGQNLWGLVRLSRNTPVPKHPETPQHHALVQHKAPALCCCSRLVSPRCRPHRLNKAFHPSLPPHKTRQSLDALAPNLSEAIQTDRRPAFAFSREIQFFLCFQTELALSRERIRGYRSQSSPTHL
jgi:hypothetical protein